MFQATNIAIGLGWTLTGLVCLALAFPLIGRQVGRNHLYGARFPEAFQSDEAWFAINQFAGWRLAIWSVPLLACGVAAFFIPLPEKEMITLLLAVAPIAFVLLPLFESWRFAKRFAASQADDRS